MGKIMCQSYVKLHITTSSFKGFPVLIFFAVTLEWLILRASWEKSK